MSRIKRLIILFVSSLLSAPKFILLAYLPSVIGAAGSWIYYFIMVEQAERFVGIFRGLLGEFLFAFSYSITAVVVIVFGIIWTAIFTATERQWKNI